MSAVSFLISDPSPALQKFVRQLLTGYGFDAAAIKTVSDPHAAAEIAQSLKPDLLLTDWFAKESLSGIDLHQSILKSSPGCRFALMSQDGSPSLAEEARRAGALFFLVKPFSADDMRSALAQALEQMAHAHPAIAQRLHPTTYAQAHPTATVQLPRLPQFKPGDRVRHGNRAASVKHVILRRGELVVQLDGVPGLVEASKLTHW